MQNSLNVAVTFKSMHSGRNSLEIQSLKANIQNGKIEIYYFENLRRQDDSAFAVTFHNL